MPSWFDSPSFPWVDPRAQRLHTLLAGAYDNVAAIRSLGKTAGIDLRSWDPAGGHGPAWERLLDVAAAQGKVGVLLERVLSDGLVSAHHGPLKELMIAGSPPDVSVTHARDNTMATAPSSPHATGPQSDTVLSLAEVNRLHGVAILLLPADGDLDALLSGLPPSFVAQLPRTGSSHGTRLYQSLHAMNRAGVLEDGTRPLVAWLEAFCLLYRVRPEVETFAAMLKDLRAGRDTHSREAPVRKLSSGLAGHERTEKSGAPRVASARPVERELPPAGGAAPSVAVSPVCVEIFHHSRLARGTEITTRLFQLLTGDRPAAFRDLHIPLRAYDRPPKRPLSRWHPEPRRCTLVLLDEQLRADVDTFLPALRARAAEPTTELVVVAPLDIPDRGLEGAPELRAIPVDPESHQAGACWLEVGILEVLCQWLPVAPGGLAAGPTRIILCPADAHGHALASSMATWMEGHDVSVSVLGDPASSLAEEDTATGVLVALRTDGWASSSHAAEALLLAKARGLPVIVAEALQDGESRSFPYLGNAPTARVTPLEQSSPHGLAARQSAAVARLALSEVLRMRLARHRLDAFGSLPAGMRTSTRPPELLDAVREEQTWLLYPDPPLPGHELDVLSHARPGLHVITPTQWLGHGRKT